MFIACSTLAAGASAADLYWFGNGITPGGSGNWSAVGSTWSPTTPIPAIMAWNPADTGVFAGAAGTVTITDPNVNAGAGLRFESTGFTLTGGSVTLTGASSAANPVNVSPAVTATSNAVIAGSAGITKLGTGTLVLGAANTYTGETVVEGGTLNLTGAINTAANTFVGYANPNTIFSIATPGTASDVDGSIGVQATSFANQVSVTGAGAAWNNSGRVDVGYDGSGNLLAVSAGGVVNSANGYLAVGSASSSNTVTVAGTGSAWTNTGDLVIGYAGSSNALTVSAGGAASTVQGMLGWASTSVTNTALITGTGSQWTNTGVLYVGVDGNTNIFNVQNGGLAISTLDTVVGSGSTAFGNSVMVSDAGSEFRVLPGRTLIIGGGGSGNVLSVTNGGLATGNNVRLGRDAGSANNVATVTGTGSAWNNTGTIRIGTLGPGNSVTVSAGGAASFSGNAFIGHGAAAANNFLRVTGTGSTWSSGALTVGLASISNVLTVDGGGSVTAPSVAVATNAGSQGTVNIGTGAVPGVLNGPISFGAGNGIVNFNHSDGAYSFANTISGAGAVRFIGSGTTILAAANTYSGGTALNAGTVRLGVNNALPASGTFAFHGGTLVANDRSAAIGALSLETNSTLNFGDATARQDLVFASAAYVGGTLTITGWDGPIGATYDRLIVTADPTASGILSNIQFSGYPAGATWISATGEIVPPALPVLPPPEAVAIPTLSPGGMVMTFLMVCAAGLFSITRQRKAMGR